MIKHPVVVTSSEPSTAFWRESASYDSFLECNFIEPLDEGVRQHGQAPHELQLAVLLQLHWYFTVDRRERAPTVALTVAQAPHFHERVRRVMRCIAIETLQDQALEHVGVEVRHALLSYKSPTMHSTVALDAYDHDQGLVRLSYYAHGDPPTEVFFIDGTATNPTYAKYRACRYFHALLLRQRIVWLPVDSASKLEVVLAGMVAPVSVGPLSFSVSRGELSGSMQLDTAALLPAVRLAYPPGKGGQQPLPPGWIGWKVRLLRALARFAPVRRRFAKAWVFVDREVDADDNAEHLYRWVREHHPEVNAWFLLQTASPDWPRLAAEGFRLVPPGLKRRLLILNSEQIISSHAEYVFGGMDRRLYGEAMQWHFTFLQHGVSMNDVSHWLGSCEFDRFITSSPAEHESIVGDDTPYPYTGREVRRTGFPRHDRLLQIAQATPEPEVNLLLVMPTWRGGLVEELSKSSCAAERLQIFASSEYVSRWRAFLHNGELRELAERQGHRVVFMPHANAAPYIEAFDPPLHVKVVMKSDSVMQQLFARAAGFVTDYTSVAFDIAVLRRAVFYYQFDRESFYGGGHNWRAGYFDYDRHGFGPVATAESELVTYLRRYFRRGAKPEREYIARMEMAMPDQDMQCCSRVFRDTQS